MQKSGVVLCALRVFAVKVLSFRHSYRKDAKVAKEDQNNFSEQDALLTGAAKKRPEPFDLSIQIFFGEAF